VPVFLAVLVLMPVVLLVVLLLVVERVHAA
jgi:hypothetical protein